LRMGQRRPPRHPSDHQRPQQCTTQGLHVASLSTCTAAVVEKSRDPPGGVCSGSLLI
jgi:hypothetical protein